MKVSVDSVLNIKAFDLSKVLQREGSCLHPEQGGQKHDLTVSNVGMQFYGPLHAGKLNSRLRVLLRDHKFDIFVSKGVLYLHGSGARHLFQCVHRLVTIFSSDDSVGMPWRDWEGRHIFQCVHRLVTIFICCWSCLDAYLMDSVGHVAILRQLLQSIHTNRYVVGML